MSLSEKSVYFSDKQALRNSRPAFARRKPKSNRAIANCPRIPIGRIEPIAHAEVPNRFPKIGKSGGISRLALSQTVPAEAGGLHCEVDLVLEACIVAQD